MKKVALFLAVLLNITVTVIGQNVGIGTTTPDASALLELKANNKGFLPPRMTAAEKAAIVTPKAGLMIYQTDGTKGLYIYDGTAWTAAISLGNYVDLATAQTINGNKTFVADVFANGVRLGRGAGNISTNTAIGESVLNSNTTGYANAGNGYRSLCLNTIGNNNTALGNQALFVNNTGNSNTAVGSRSLYFNNGYSNTAIGQAAISLNTVGSNLVAVGDSALFNNTTGLQNTAIGSKSLFSNTSGYSNSANGFPIFIF